MKKAVLILLFAVSLITCDNLLAATLEVGAGQTYTTIQSAITASSSYDTINVHAGTYTETVTISKPLTVQRNTGDVPVIHGHVIIATGINEVTIDGLTITSAGSSTGPGIYSVNSNRITIKNNHIYEMIDATIDGDGIQINSGHSSDGTYANGIIIHDNLVHDNDVDGMKLHGQYYTIYNNTIHGDIDTNYVSDSPDGIQLNAGTDHGYTATQHVKIFNNTIYNHAQNIYCEGSTPSAFDCSDIQIYNNVLYHESAVIHGVDMDSIYAWSIHVKWGKDVWIYNNTIGRSKGPCVRLRSNSPGTIHIKNNIFSNSHLNGDYGVWSEINTDLADGELDYNIYNMASSKIVSWGGPSYTTLAAFQAAYPTMEIHGLSANPLLNSFPTPTLQSGSPAITAGANLGISYNVDKSGFTRPSAPAPWDIGAYQFDTLYPSPPVLNSVQ